MAHSVKSHHITSHHTSQLNTPHHITSHSITSQHITSHHITSHQITSHHTTSHHITSHHNAPQRATYHCLPPSLPPLPCCAPTPHLPAALLRLLPASGPGGSGHAAEGPKGMGLAQKLLEKMGWKEGDGLGKNRQGMSTPLVAQKIDRRAGEGLRA